jgi:hypothetical protein
MKRYLALALVLSLACLGVPTAAFAAGQQQVQSVDGKVSGTARHSTGQPVTNRGIRLRNAADGQVVAKSTTDGTGAFAFSNVPKGTFVVELLDDAGQVIATSTAVTLGAAPAGMTVTGVLVTLSDTAAAAAVAGAAAGGSFFTSTWGILVLAGAAAGTTIAIVATKGDASPSK